MISSDPTAEEGIFTAAVALPVAERAAYVERACSGQPGLRGRVEALLRSHDSGDFMDARTAPPPDEVGLPPWACSRAERAGDFIGRYRLLQRIGEGGFGVVWMAEQVAPIKRQVALKIIRAGMDTEEVVARFRAESQAMALMDHPHIAKVFDVGTTDRGRPFFVMELVPGMAITKFCDRERLSLRQRLELFVDVCSAINHAHQKGVIHRDIKPSNVMVTLQNGRPTVRVIDFGIAKAVQGRLTDHTVRTQHEQFMGTPAYMSPEQTALDHADVDTRSDIYALGILLYELLAGSAPFDPKSLGASGPEEIRRVIREVEPPRPSTRLHTADGMERAALAEARQATPEKLHRLVELDLDWIVMKAIEKDRTRRYETANGFAQDIRRFLADEPVIAGPPSKIYRFRKFARRHTVFLRLSAAFAALLIAATAVSIWLAVRATEAEQQAVRRAAAEAEERKIAQSARLEVLALAQFFRDVLSSMDPERGGRRMTVEEAMHQAFATMEREFDDSIRGGIAPQHGNLWTLHTLGFTREVIPLQEKVRHFHHTTLGPRHVKSLLSSLNLAFYIIRGGGSEGDLEKARIILEELVALEDAWPPDNFKEWMETLANLAQCYEYLRLPEQAVATYQKGLDSCLERFPRESNPTLQAMSGLATALFAADRTAEAIALREEALSIHKKINGMKNQHTLLTMHSLANLYHDSGQWERALRLREEAVPLLREILPANHPHTLMASHGLARSWFAVGRKTDAIELLEEVTQGFLITSGRYHHDTLQAMHDLATWYYDAGRLEEALAIREEVLPLRSTVMGAEHTDTLEALSNLAVSYHAAGRLSTATELQEAALSQMRHLLPPGHPETAEAMRRLAECHEATGRLGDAEALRREAAAGASSP